MEGRCGDLGRQRGKEREAGERCAWLSGGALTLKMVVLVGGGGGGESLRCRVPKSARSLGALFLAADCPAPFGILALQQR